MKTDLYHLQYTANFTPDEDGNWEVGLSIAGKGNLFIDDKLVIDLSTNPVQGESFFGLGTTDVRVVAKDLKAGQTYRVEIRLSNAEFLSRGSPFTCRGGIRLGAIHEMADAIQEAVQLAKGSDGLYMLFFFFLSCPSHFMQPSFSLSD
jgi:beta-glucosidase